MSLGYIPTERRVRMPASAPRPAVNIPRTVDSVWCVSTLAYSSVALLAWVASVISSRLTTFTVVSNFAFAVDVLALLYLSYRYDTAIHPVVFSIVPIVSLLGASSFAFHDENVLNVPKHTLDIFFGWMLYVYLACVSLFTVLRQLMPTRVRQISIGVVLLLNIAIIPVVQFYDSVYANQMALFFVCGAFTYVCTLVHRYVARRRSDQVRDVVAAAHALWDVGTLVALQAVTTTFQGQFWHDSQSPDHYAIEHGYWHLGNGMVVLVIVLYNTQSSPLADVPRLSVYDSIVQVALWLFLFALLGLCLGVEDMAVYLPIAITAQIVMFLVSLVCSVAALRR